MKDIDKFYYRQDRYVAFIDTWLHDLRNG